ncbi:hypothetical protein [Bacillus sp. T33-2]|uniref:hypothetical protein n=1 Tax=Bacillus sp. T33-2 TaxID=2054168 RepID=UPI0015E0816C|nr:hypothetical protein [Bacillus sp. T33-2]
MTKENGRKNQGNADDVKGAEGSLLPVRVSEDNRDPFLIEGKGDPNLSPDAGRPLI